MLLETKALEMNYNEISEILRLQVFWVRISQMLYHHPFPR